MPPFLCSLGPPKAVPTPACRPLLPAACPFQQRAAQHFAHTAGSPVAPCTPITWQGWGGAAAAGRVPDGPAPPGSASWVDGCSPGGSSALSSLSSSPGPIPLVAFTDHEHTLLLPLQLSQQPSCLGISHPALAVNGKLSQEDTLEHRQEGSGTGPRGKAPFVSLRLHQPQALLCASLCFLPRKWG